ncbi:MAG: 2Fe-2S iron-sulfur cluster-binding protein, partial [Nitrospira sp.]|nr:2Fe-2S iron-sulfur cluster-binding protein [Nitrospira sp.]
MNIILNGHRIIAEPGDTVYQAARKAGIAIPSLCASDHLKPFGSCRLCLCEVEGQSGTPATCTMPAREGLVLRTDTERLQRLRHNVVELYLSEQPAAGPVPDALQRLADSNGVHSVRYQNPLRRQAYRDDSNPFFRFDNDACVSCARCVRACDELQGTFALTMFGRGFDSRPAAGASQLSALSDQPSALGFATSNCVSCGACVKECPTGALSEKRVLEQGVPTATVRKTC